MTGLSRSQQRPNQWQHVNVGNCNRSQTKGRLFLVEEQFTPGERQCLRDSRSDAFGRPEAKQSDPRKEAVGARASGLGRTVEDLNRGHRRAALGVGRLSRRRHSCPKGRPWVRCKSGVSQVAAGVVLGEPGFA